MAEPKVCVKRDDAGLQAMRSCTTNGFHHEWVQYTEVIYHTKRKPSLDDYENSGSGTARAKVAYRMSLHQ